MVAGDCKVGITTAKGFNCTYFDGIDDCVILPWNKKFSPHYKSFAVSAWLFNGTNDGIETDAFFNTYKAPDGGFFVGVKDEALNCYVRDSAANTAFGDICGAGECPKNQWVHVVANFNRTTGVLTAYINGVASATTLNIAAITGDIDSNDTTYSFIGFEKVDLDYYNGAIRDLRYFHDYLTAAEIASLYAGSSVTRNLVGYWKLHSDVLDYSGNGYNGTVSGGITYINLDSDLKNAIKAQRVGANDKWLITGGKGGNVYHAEIEG